MTPDPLHEINILANNMLEPSDFRCPVCRSMHSAIFGHVCVFGFQIDHLLPAPRIAELSDSGKGEG